LLVDLALLKTEVSSDTSVDRIFVGEFHILRDYCLWALLKIISI